MAPSTFKYLAASVSLSGAGAVRLLVAEFEQGPDDDWILRSSSLACETNDDHTTISVLDHSVEDNLQDCFRTCEQHLDCVAVDWFPNERKCNRFPRACTVPTTTGGMSYVMAQEPMKAKACASWNETMYFLGADWLSTDVSPQEIIDVMQGAFSQCGPDDQVTVRIEEKDVGYSIGSDWATWLYNSVLQHFNDEHQLFHSGIRFTGCGKTVMFQLQLRTWGLSNAGPIGTTAFASSYQYPITSPDGLTMWNELMCDVPGRGMRDVGTGNIVYYKVQEENEYTPWVRGEYPITHLAARDMGEFISGVARYFSWWNMKSVYAPEAVIWEGADGASTRLKSQVTCDAFTLWMASQLIAFEASKGYPPDFPPTHWAGVHVNRLAVTLSDADSEDGPAPVTGDLSELLTNQHVELAQLKRAWHPANKQASNGIWATIKGAGICWDVPVAERREVIERNWRDSREYTTMSNRFSFLHGRNPLDLRFYCVDRVQLATSGYDLVSFGPRRFFYLSNGKYAVAMDWDVKIDTAYDNYGVFDTVSGKAVVPAGLPLGPWHAHTHSSECGAECPWEYPVPDPGENGFHN